ncbi:MAG: cytochrome c biogenesis protein CcsA [Salibacteraceae bacterium]|nr:cytochrome c biogenesis protein CcsA [Salibacteraceae bacterium]|tara:strand:+ start:52153 stop:52815 length:663 start_codon:yes stop_codon:yes gene_type:complete
MGKNWWKILGVVLVSYSIVGGFLVPVPELPILNETIRNTYFHIPMWFAMMALLSYSLFHSIKFLAGFDLQHDNKADQSVQVALVLGLFGLLTGMVWAQYTWGSFWTNDVKLNGTAISMLTYLAYIILRGSIEDEHRKAKVAAVYNIFAWVMMILFIMVIPRLNDSLHPGNGGNPAFGSYDMDNTMRIVFYPAVIGWILIGAWITSIKIRIKNIDDTQKYA